MGTENGLQRPACRNYYGERIRASENCTITLVTNCEGCQYRKREMEKQRNRRKRIRRWNRRIDRLEAWFDRNDARIKAALNDIGCSIILCIFGFIFIWLLFFAEDGSTVSAAPEKQIKAINGNYYYSESDYDQYLEERQEYLDAEAAEWESLYKYNDAEE